ncbi:MAG TPA: DUF3090 family protein [Actinomycetota bacterium]|jgi:uncharacterized repeat protein (TIGR03847 family)|nr:DUF3090 family protein [Actinomycetota bacterium]
MIVEMTPDVITADYVGRPGRRAFYLQGRKGEETCTLLLEKEQVAVLADRLRELLLMVDASDTIAKATPARDPALSLAEPVEPDARAASIGIAFLEEEERVLIAVEAAGTGDEEEGVEPDEYRFLVRRDQVRALLLHALASVGEGREICQLCGLPMDPEGHHCPASNGHRPAG